jgi:hypothetical protein
MSTLQPTQHIERRQQQRGVPRRLIDLILAHHDVDLEAGGGCRIFRVSRRALGGSTMPGTRQDIERLGRLALVYSETSGRLVTVMHVCAGSQGRRYRRQGR